MDNSVGFRGMGIVTTCSAWESSIRTMTFDDNAIESTSEDTASVTRGAGSVY